jgi:hypothetical protein
MLPANEYLVIELRACLNCSLSSCLLVASKLYSVDLSEVTLAFNYCLYLQELHFGYD